MDTLLEILQIFLFPIGIAHAVYEESGWRDILIIGGFGMVFIVCVCLMMVDVF